MGTDMRKSIRLSEEDYQKIEKIRLENGISDFTKTVCYILRDYRRLQEENGKLRESNEKQMTRIRLASNGADVNVQVLLEVANTLCWQLKTKDFQPTDQMLHPALEQAQKTVKDRIARFKQAKDSKTNK